MTMPTFDPEVTIRAGDREVAFDSLEDFERAAESVARGAVAGTVEPPPGTMILRSRAVQDAAEALIERFPDTFAHLGNWTIAYVEDGKPPKRGCDALVRVVILPPYVQQLYGEDVMVSASSTLWEHGTPESKEAALFHALLHIETVEDEEGNVQGVKKAKHQVEAFLEEVTYFGAWHPAIAEVAKQLTIFEDSTGHKAATPETSPTRKRTRRS